jgi:uncharacterized protein (TIGR03435 family)
MGMRAFAMTFCLCVALSAQNERFDAASIKPNTEGPMSKRSAYQGRRFTSRYVTIRELISSAYGAQEHALTSYQVFGGPKWLDSDRFDVVATAPDVPDSVRGTFPAPMLARLRTLLEERCRLETHFETREQPVFALVLARSDGKLGPKLRPRPFGCISAAAAAAEATAIGPVLKPRICASSLGPGIITAKGATMTNMASAFVHFVPGVDRVVLDRTGLTGTFDVDLTWKWEGTGEYAGIPPVDRNAPEFFTALQEQLGLKLEATRAPVEVLVIDHAERPSPD